MDSTTETTGDGLTAHREGRHESDATFRLLVDSVSEYAIFRLSETGIVTLLSSYVAPASVLWAAAPLAPARTARVANAFLRRSQSARDNGADSPLAINAYTHQSDRRTYAKARRFHGVVSIDFA
jgi:hypothetical protein